LARLGPTIHHRRTFSPVAASYGDLVVTGEILSPALPL
jgi:hypothetical protein